MNISDWVKAASEIWKQAGAILWTLTAALFVPAAALTIGAYFEWRGFVSRYDDLGALLWLGTLSSLVVATGKTVVTRLSRSPVNLIPNELQSFANFTRQSSGIVTSQLHVDLDVYNATEEFVRLARVKLKKPRSSAERLAEMIIVQDDLSGAHSSRTVIPPFARRHGAIDMIIGEDLRKQIKKGGLVFDVVDDMGQTHRLKIAKVRVSGEPRQ